jgi:oligopeptide transport system substrate-binding protein
MGQSIQLTVLLCSIFITLVGCVKKSKDIIVTLPTGQKEVLAFEETLVAAFNSEPPTLDWTRGSDMDSALLQENIMEGLTSFDLFDPELGLRPALATNWTPENNGQKWTLSLRTGVRWSDGMEFTAQHVYDGWQRLLDPLTASPYSYFLFSIKNAKAFNEGKITDFKQVGIKILGDYLIEVELEKAMSFFPMLLTHHSTFPIRNDLLDRFGPEWVKPENIVTLGPYKIVYWAHDDELLLQRNETYYGKKPQVKNVLFYIVGKESTALRLFDRGKIDFVKDLPTADIQKIRQRPEYKSMPGLRLYYYGFKTMKEPVNDRRVRQAIAHAIDRAELVKILGGGQSPLKSWIPKGMFGHNSGIGLDFNPKKAKSLLNKAGYNGDKKVPKIILGFNTSEKHQRVAENIQAQLKKNLGLTVELKNEEWKTYLNNLKTESDYTTYRLGWVADYPDPDNFLSILLSYASNNRTGWKNQKYDQLIDSARSDLRPENRRRIYQKAQELLVEQEVPAIPLFSDVNNILVNKRLKNFPLNPIEKYLFKEVRIEP